MKKIAVWLLFLALLGNFEIIEAEEMKIGKNEGKLALVGPLPVFDHPLLLGIEKAHPDGYNSPMEAWEALGLYAQQGNAYWIMAVCHHRNISKDHRVPWTIIPLARQDSKGNLNCGLENMLRISEKLEVRFTMVRAFMDANYSGIDMENFKQNVLLGKIPAPICPPDLKDVLNLIRTSIFQKFMPEHRSALSQMEISYTVTPAGIFMMSLKNDGIMYKKFHNHKKKYETQARAMEALQKFPAELPADFVGKVRYSANMLNHGYSDVALARLAKGNDATAMKEFKAKKKLLAEYIALLEKNGMTLKFVPFQNQEKFWQ